MINLVAYYVFGVPVGMALALGTDLGVLGMWIGLAVAINIQTVSIGIALLCLNWSKEAEKAMARGKGQQEEGEEMDKDRSVVATEAVEMKKYVQLTNEDGEELVTEENEEEPHPPDQTQLLDQTCLIEGDAPVNDATDISNSNDTASLISDDGLDGIAKHCGMKHKLRSRLKLVLCHISLVTIACVCLILSGIVSTFDPPDSVISGNYSECSMNDSEVF